MQSAALRFRGVHLVRGVSGLADNLLDRAKLLADSKSSLWSREALFCFLARGGGLSSIM